MNNFYTLNSSFYLTNLVISLVLLIILLGLRKILIIKLKKISPQTETKIDDAALILIEKTHILFVFYLAFYFGFYTVRFKTEVETILNKFFIVVLIIQLALWGGHAINFLIYTYFRKKNNGENDHSEKATISFIIFITKIVFFTNLFLFGLSQMGVDITTLVTGLGVGGIAIALAVQNILGDLFASMTIVLDKPFMVDDFIMVDTLSGTVVHIGLKTTRLKSVSGEQLIFSNSDLLQSRIKNFKRMNERRATFLVGVTYETPQDKLEKIKPIIIDIIDKIPNARIERCHFINFGSSSLDFETVYWINSKEFQVYRDVQELINLKLFDALNSEGISFAYPTQTLHLNQVKI